MIADGNTIEMLTEKREELLNKIQPSGYNQKYKKIVTPGLPHYLQERESTHCIQNAARRCEGEKILGGKAKQGTKSKSLVKHCIPL